MKKILLLLLFVMSLTLEGCFNYRDLDKALYVTSIIVDSSDENTVEIYAEAFRPFRSSSAGSGKGERIIFKGKGKTAFEAARDLNLTSSYKLNYTQNKVIIYTKRAAEKGMDNTIDFFDRDQEMLLRTYVVVLLGDPEQLLKVDLKEEEYLGVFIYNLIENLGASSRAVQLDMNDFLVRSYQKVDCVVTAIDVRSEVADKKVEINGGGVIGNFKLLDIMTRNEGEGYNFLIDRIKTGTLEIPNPDSSSKFLTLEILNSDTKTKLYKEEDKYILKKKIHVKTSVGEAQEGLSFDKNTLKKISQTAEGNITKACNLVYNNYRKKNLDIFFLKLIYERTFNKPAPENLINNTDLEIDVKVNIEGSSDIKSFK
ncbi:MAG: spore germination protein [Clostridiaceae bacterium]|jgi:Ger(x)C family germination protein|nr:spore germination protein [Clostridiaceae bacterium]